MNPGEIEIHLQTSDHNDWRINPTSRFTLASNTHGSGTMGDNYEGKAEEITYETALWEVVMVLRKEHMGLTPEK